MAQSKILKKETDFPTTLKYKFYVYQQYFPDSFKIPGKVRSYHEPVEQENLQLSIHNQTIQSISTIPKKREESMMDSFSMLSDSNYSQINKVSKFEKSKSQNPSQIRQPTQIKSSLQKMSFSQVSKKQQSSYLSAKSTDPVKKGDKKMSSLMELDSEEESPLNKNISDKDSKEQVASNQNTSFLKMIKSKKSESGEIQDLPGNEVEKADKGGDKRGDKWGDKRKPVRLNLMSSESENQSKQSSNHELNFYSGIHQQINEIENEGGIRSNEVQNFHQANVELGANEKQSEVVNNEQMEGDLHPEQILPVNQGNFQEDVVEAVIEIERKEPAESFQLEGSNIIENFKTQYKAQFGLSWLQQGEASRLKGYSVEYKTQRSQLLSEKQRMDPPNSWQERVKLLEEKVVCLEGEVLDLKKERVSDKELLMTLIQKMQRFEKDEQFLKEENRKFREQYVPSLTSQLHLLGVNLMEEKRKKNNT